ncbi:trimeric intracellular cation channel family protein [Verrucomicrobiota bacterium sgz303538]
MKTLLLALDLAGTFVFALSGAFTAVKHRLDLFGILVLSLAAATFGGIGRDLLIGAVPPAALMDWRYIAVPVIAGITVFFTYSETMRLYTAVLLLDGAGLAFFAVSGALKALAFGVTPLAAILLGALTGIGGGIARNILVAEIPTVLQTDLYAVPALVGAFVVVIGKMMQFPTLPVAVLGGGLCFGIRLLAIRYDWRLPRASESNKLTSNALRPGDKDSAKTKGDHISPRGDNENAEKSNGP